MAGYSGTPLWKKLGISSGFRVAVLNEPIGFRELLEGLLDDVQFAECVDEGGPFDVIIQFADRREHIVSNLNTICEALVSAGGYWIAWPKRASKVPTDITEQALRDLILPTTTLVDNKVCAIDETWSGLRFVRRKAFR